MTSSVRTTTSRENRWQAFAFFVVLLHGWRVYGFTPTSFAVRDTSAWPTTNKLPLHRSCWGRLTQSRNTAVPIRLDPKRGREQEQRHHASALCAAPLLALNHAGWSQAALASLLFGFREVHQKIWILATRGTSATLGATAYFGLAVWALYLVQDNVTKVQPQQLKVVYEGLAKPSLNAQEFAKYPLGMALCILRFTVGSIPATILSILFPKSRSTAVYQDALKRIPNTARELANEFLRLLNGKESHAAANVFFKTVVFAPIYEELVFRQILSLVFVAPSSWVIMGCKPWVLLSSLLFGLVHVGNVVVPLPQNVDWQHPENINIAFRRVVLGSFWATNAFLGALWILAPAFEKRGIFASIGAHMLWNFYVFLVGGFRGMRAVEEFIGGN